MACHDAETLIEQLSRIANLACAVGKILLVPSVRDCPQQRYQRSRRRDDHLSRYAILNQLCIRIHGCAEEDFAGEKQDDKIGSRLELVPVSFCSEHVDVLPNLPSM